VVEDAEGVDEAMSAHLLEINSLGNVRITALGTYD